MLLLLCLDIPFSSGTLVLCSHDRLCRCVSVDSLDSLVIAFVDVFMQTAWYVVLCFGVYLYMNTISTDACVALAEYICKYLFNASTLLLCSCR